MARYRAHLVAGGRSSAAVKKDRAALNTLLRWLAEHERVPAAQAREALAVTLPRTERTERERPKSLSAARYERLIRGAKARIADDPLAGARNIAIVLALGDAGLRCEELAHLERRDFLPARKGAQLRTPTSATARATASGASSSALTPPGRSCAGTASAPARSARRGPVFITRGPAPARSQLHARQRRSAPACARCLRISRQRPHELKHVEAPPRSAPALLARRSSPRTSAS